MKSENLGGLVSMAGSCVFFFGGDVSGAVVSVSFIAAELTLARWGHRRAGYSIGCALFSFGDVVAVISKVAYANRAFQATLLAMAAIWAIGALRAPAAWLGQTLARPWLVACADAIQPLAGTMLLILRIPGIAAAFIGANYLGVAALSCWAVSDVLVGRLQNSISTLRRAVHSLLA
jgi:hypothetical protein